MKYLYAVKNKYLVTNIKLTCHLVYETGIAQLVR